jgi:hypothetical protein
MNLYGTTTKGDDFEVYINEKGEIQYTDVYGDSLTWDNNKTNRDSIIGMVKEISEGNYSIEEGL